MEPEKPLNVLYLSYDGMTDPLGQSQVIPYLKGLRDKYTFWLISFEKQERFRKEGQEIKTLLDQLGIHWYPNTYHKKPPVISTLYDLLFMYFLARKLVKKSGIGLVHCRSYPSGLVGLRLKRNLKTKFLFDIRGFWANERVDGGIWNLRNPFYRLVYNYFKKMEAEMMSEADHIISLTHAGKEEIVSGRLFEFTHQRIPEQKITVIPCAVDLELFDPEKITENQREDLRNHLGLTAGDKVLCYLGSIGTWYLLDEMLSFFKKWKAMKPEYKFLFVTPDDPSIILDKAFGMGLQETDLVISRATRSEVPAYLSISDLGIFFIKPAYSKKASSATKMGEIMAIGLPVVTNRGVGDVDFYFKNASIFDKIKSNEGEAYYFIHNYDRNLLSDSYSLKSGVARYMEVYKFL